MVTGAFETLRSAGRPLELELPGESELPERAGGAARRGAVPAGRGARTRRSRACSSCSTAAPVAEKLLDLSGYAVKGRARERFATYEEARARVERAALDELARRDRDLLQQLLQAFAEAYRAAKDRDSALDFEDLQLYARDLLAGTRRSASASAGGCARSWSTSSRTRTDSNANWSTCSPGRELFFVGDEFQSIYRFRHADVEVFRERREQTGGVLALTENYRSRPEVLEVINHLFSADFGTSFQPLSAAGRFPDPAFGPAVELLVTDKSTYSDTGIHWRKAEAQHVARRLREIVDAGEATPGEIVLLFAAGTDARLYEEELRAARTADLPRDRPRLLQRQQVVDLLAYLRLLQNRYDDEALVTVLASPFVGVSNDALVLLRRAAGRRPLYAGIERGLPRGHGRARPAALPRLPPALRAAGRGGQLAFRSSACASRSSSSTTTTSQCSRRRTAGAATRTCASSPGSRARTRSCAAATSRASSASSASRTPSARASWRRSPRRRTRTSIRLLTIHAAKGLEFKVVVVADAGRDSRASRDEVLCLPDGRLGFKVAHPSTGKRLPTTGYEEVKEVEAEAERDERRRLYYVAMTRAIDRLIVSGSIDPGRASDAETPIGWVLERLGPEELERAGDAPLEIVRDDARLVLRVDRFRPTAPARRGRREDEEETQLSLFAAGEAVPLRIEVPPLPELEPVPAAPEYRIRRLSYSALALFERCSYRFYAERIAGMRPARRTGEGEPALAATEVGDAVHGLLERIDLAAPGVPDDSRALVHARYPFATMRSWSASAS